MTGSMNFTRMIMARPVKLTVETKTYNLTIPVTDYDMLSEYSNTHTERYGTQISVADLIRSAITLYLEDLRQEEEARVVSN
jgi:hypothetical protein|tara:strand:+ start:130 stop:372 length:243 start_codon:yes stop_codon:yes gene_type:complete